MKKILFYFDCTILTSRAIDLIKLLKHKLEFDVYFHELDDHSKWILVNIHNYNNINIKSPFNYYSNYTPFIYYKNYLLYIYLVSFTYYYTYLFL